MKESMKFPKLSILTFLFALLFCGCTREQPGEENQPVADPETEQSAVSEIYDGPYLSGTANVYLSEEMADYVERTLSEGQALTKADAMSSLAEIGVVSMERIFPDAGEFEARGREMGMHRWYRVTYGRDVNRDEARKVLLDVPGILNYEPVIKTQSHAIEYPFNDPQLPSQWNYYNDGSGSGWRAGADVDVIPVWLNITTGSSHVVVAVVDSGVDSAHEDLQGVVDTDNSYGFYQSTKSYSPGDHGTHVAGTIAAVNNNGIGVSGIAGGDAAAGVKGVSILSCAIFSPAAGPSGDGAQAIRWAADHGAVLCNNSWGYDFNDDSGNYDAESAKNLHEFFLQPNEGEYASSLKTAIDYFNKYAGMDSAGNQVGPMAGGLVFFSAGNDNREWGAPAGYPGAIAVGAIGPQGTKAYYSCYGDWVDIAAPGGDANYSMVLSTAVDNNYIRYQGTSMACPHVTGVAALVLSALQGKGFTREMLLERLLEGYNRNFSLKGMKIGNLVDAYGAITYGEDSTPDAVSNLTATAHSNTVTATWSVTGKGYLGAAGYQVFYGTSEDAVKAAQPENPGADVSVGQVSTREIKLGRPVSFVVKDLGFETTYYFKVVGFDQYFHFGDASNVAVVRTEVNNPPVITPSVALDNLRIKTFETLTLTLAVSEPDGHTFQVEYRSGSSGETWSENSPGTYTLRISGAAAEEGAHTAVVTATDSYGAAYSLSIPYTILPNTPPANARQFENILLNNAETQVFTLSEYISDPDGETLSFSVNNTNTGSVHANVASGTLHLTAIGYGLAEITVTGKDAKGETAVQTFKVLVRDPQVAYQAYPNPVKDNLYIATGLQTESTEIALYTFAGGKVLEETVQSSAFDPATIDMSRCAPGQYALTLRFGGNEYRQTIIKR